MYCLHEDHMATYVVCIDGTWNRPEESNGDPLDGSEISRETNVYRIFRFLADNPTISAEGITLRASLPATTQTQTQGEVLYVKGIGTSSFNLVNYVAGAIGYGTMDRILVAYRFLAERYKPGDKIFGFGFSRGAFAVRSLAGMLDRMGLSAALGRLDDATLTAQYQSSSTSSPTSVPVCFLGLWDTVGSLRKPENISDHEVNPPNVKFVAHALALDEQRRDFTPTFWRHGGGSQKVEEVWFSGVHSNIGGGYTNAQLSNIALSWMVAKAVANELPAGNQYIPHWYYENVFTQMTDSYREFLRYLSVLGSVIKGDRERRTVLSTHRIHESVFDRMEGGTSLYVTTGSQAQADRDPYEPVAHVDAGHWTDSRAAFKGRIVETTDYLPMEVLDFQRNKL